MFATKVKGVAQAVLWLCVAAVVVALSFVDVTPLLGAHQKGLSLTSIFMPLTGTFVGWLAPLVTFLRGLIAFTKTGSYWSFCLYLPGLFAAWAWRSRNFFLHFVVPLACMFIFVMHPQGAGAPLYALYWLIPACLWVTDGRSLFERALATTFIAHAVGSIVWLYAYNIPASLWNSLVVVVLFERLLFALALVSVYNTAHIVFFTLQSYVNGRFLKGWNGR